MVLGIPHLKKHPHFHTARAYPLHVDLNPNLRFQASSADWEVWWS